MSSLRKATLLQILKLREQSEPLWLWFKSQPDSDFQTSLPLISSVNLASYLYYLAPCCGNVACIRITGWGLWGGVVKKQIPEHNSPVILIHQVGGGAEGLAFLTSSQVMLFLPGPHVE